MHAINVQREPAQELRRLAVDDCGHGLFEALPGSEIRGCETTEKEGAPTKECTPGVWNKSDWLPLCGWHALSYAKVMTLK